MSDQSAPARAATPAPLAESALLAERLRELMAKARPDDWLAHRVFRPAFDNDRVSVILIGDDAWLAELLFDNLPTLLAALDGREAGWLPIESAPRDGTTVDLWANGRKVNCGWSSPMGSWCREGGHNEGYAYSVPVERPTHWRPLPAPPARPQPAGEPE